MISFGKVIMVWEMYENSASNFGKGFELERTGGQKSPFSMVCLQRGSPVRIKSSLTGNLIQFSQWEHST